MSNYSASDSDLASPSEAFRDNRSKRLATAKRFSNKFEDELNSQIYDKYAKYAAAQSETGRRDLVSHLAAALDFCKANCQPLAVLFAIECAIVALLLDQIKPGIVCVSRAREWPGRTRVGAAPVRRVDRAKFAKVTLALGLVALALSVYAIHRQPSLRQRVFACASSTCS